MKQLSYLFVLLFFIIGTSKLSAQTNVSGSLHSNTTWTLSNSPYHITSTVYVFPGVTLTIEPGVKVIFDGNYTLEVRGKIIANGSSSNQIYFCGKLIISNNDSFYAVWDRVYIEPNNKGTGEFEHCVFKDAGSALAAGGTVNKLKHCTFESNQVALDGFGIYNSTYQTVDDCVFKYNRIGVQFSSAVIFNNCEFSDNDQGMYAMNQCRMNQCTFTKNRNGLNIYNGNIYNCTFKQNEFGIKAPNFDGNFYNKLDTIKGCTIEDNDVGMEDSADGAGRKLLIIDNSISMNRIGYRVIFAGDITGTYPSIVKNNKICNNSEYNVVNFNNQNKNFTDNCFCTDDSTEIEDKLYDGYDDPGLGLLTYNIYDSECDQKIQNNFKNLPVADKDTGCLNFATCETFTGLYAPLKAVLALKVYPNPSSTEFTLKCNDNADALVNIYDQYGRVVLKQYISLSNHGTLTIDVSDWSQGVYKVELIQNGKRSLGSLIKL